MSFDRPTPTSYDIARLEAPVVVIALGSWEQHGRHLPLDTDTRIAEELARRLVRHRADTVLGPTIGVSSSGEHADFPGTLSIGGPVVTELLIELVRSADWASGVVVVNGHGGNATHLDTVRDRLAAEERRVLVWSPSLVDPRDSHAGYVETSVMMAIAPHDVRYDEIGEGPTPHLSEVLEDLRRSGVRSVSPSGVLGDPRRADPELGWRILTSWQDQLISAVTEWRSSFGT